MRIEEREKSVQTVQDEGTIYDTDRSLTPIDHSCTLNCNLCAAVYRIRPMHDHRPPVVLVTTPHGSSPRDEVVNIV